MVTGLGSDGSVAGYVISVTSADGFDGNITLAVGLSADGTVNGISFTELNETAGMGMKCGEDEFKNQFNGVNTDQFTLDKSGSASADNEINSVSGASISSGAVVNAVNTALAFYTATVE
ncbi:MAG: FMN-binding protein [Lachnospiraceae bacterium]|nr:FMN-binding protein [Lachnospiraceae bacterium]